VGRLRSWCPAAAPTSYFNERGGLVGLFFTPSPVSPPTPRTFASPATRHSPKPRVSPHDHFRLPHCGQRRQKNASHSISSNTYFRPAAPRKGRVSMIDSNRLTTAAPM